MFLESLDVAGNVNRNRKSLLRQNRVLLEPIGASCVRCWVDMIGFSMGSSKRSGGGADLDLSKDA